MQRLDYHSKKNDYRRGATVAARVGAGLVCVALVGVMVYLALRMMDRPGGGAAYWPSVAAAAGGFVYCLLIALGVIGRHKRGG